MAKSDSEQSASYGAMERFLIWFLIPFVFTAVLLGVLLTIFDYDIMNSALKTANKIPIVGRMIPVPQSETPAASSGDNQVKQEEAAPTPEEKAQEIAREAASKDAELQKAEAAIQQRDQTIKDLQLKNSELEEQMKSKAQSDEEYTAQIQQLAAMYAKMTPSKSAPILENLTLSEQVLVLSMMKTDERVKVLEKMDPKKAAEASILLKDQKQARDMQIAALQERLKQATVPAAAAATDQLSKDDLGSTFANMTPKSAATVLLELQNTNPEKVISILKSVDNAGRSKILSAISDASKETAALISARLVQ
ncbi:Flagellar motility protein MotE, a chaperone for MotC folding [Paenibacillus sp. UNCCL117]|uniref:hypothetical protein n=1 Tax=unclassified Paenibacillus TaxID=185978 RepID=UPI0008924E04|nr:MULTISPECIES: hypothetical protein [unclassified Paenibacillus]SDC86237.1 Flagellar motility protein MotE, a chaperone for MotC folding [Paenibacillus sp. cl123]SFW27758.1 Flagellar motility protein MotE, a chaperone for MotC folding [Paenibacillus sp. UNCCL117]